MLDNLRIKLIILAVTGLGCLALGWFIHGKVMKPQVITQTKTVTQTVVTKPDGTTTTTTSSSEPVVIPPSNQTKYSVTVRHRVTDKPSIREVEADVGVRLIGNFWGTAGFDFRDNSIMGGIRYEW